ncbi:MAG: hypothetical protein ABIP07_02160 [Sphingomicrobium sp.]
MLSLGVTGHRSEMLGEHVAAIAVRVDEAMEAITKAAFDLYGANAGWFAECVPRLTMVSPLADGADQIAAEIALSNGYELQVVLPFSKAESRAALTPASRAAFDRLAEKAHCLLELPGDPANPLDAYVMVGRATVAHCDLLVAIWDGEAARGRGGTGDVVELAMGRGTPVVHIPIDPARPVTLMWSAYDPAVITQHSNDVDRRPFDAAHLTALLNALLTPPQDQVERRFAETFAAERMVRMRARIEYPLLLAIAGIARFGSDRFREARSEAVRQSEWHRYKDGCVDRHRVSFPIDLVAETHDWSDRLATRFAQTYRSGHVLNFVLAAAAVVIGLGGFLMPHYRLALAAFEFVLALSIIINTRVGVTQQWHRRWLDYRQLAERLRPLRSLKLVAIAAPDPPGDATNPVARRWIEWYAAAIWRGMGCPSGSIAAADVADIAESVAAHEVDPQVAYHRRHGIQINALDQRLQRISGSIFWITLLASIVTMAALALRPEWVSQWSNWLTLVSAGLPAIGTAIFGIRFQGDFGGSAVRSAATAVSLADIARALRGNAIGLSRAADLTEQVARAMFADLSEWRLVNQQHDLSISS